MVDKQSGVICHVEERSETNCPRILNAAVGMPTYKHWSRLVDGCSNLCILCPPECRKIEGVRVDRLDFINRQCVAPFRIFDLFRLANVRGEPRLMDGASGSAKRQEPELYLVCNVRKK